MPTEGSPNTVSINLPAAKWQRVESCEYLYFNLSVTMSLPIWCRLSRTSQHLFSVGKDYVFFYVFSPSLNHAVTMFIESNHGAESTYLHGLKVFGSPIHGTDVAKISSGW